MGSDPHMKPCPRFFKGLLTVAYSTPTARIVWLVYKPFVVEHREKVSCEMKIFSNLTEFKQKCTSGKTWQGRRGCIASTLARIHMDPLSPPTFIHLCLPYSFGVHLTPSFSPLILFLAPSQGNSIHKQSYI